MRSHFGQARSFTIIIPSTLLENLSVRQNNKEWRLDIKAISAVSCWRLRFYMHMNDLLLKKQILSHDTADLWYWWIDLSTHASTKANIVMQMQKKWNDSRNAKSKLLIHTQDLIKLPWPFWHMTPMNFFVNKELPELSIYLMQVWDGLG